ncbi:MAG: hypothetical protein H6849_01930 [Alphaproteobacteria bacterium]|nr:MAG: hypothetical protein H6849_01930 [Alphaproteobacteria bacterium]
MIFDKIFWRHTLRTPVCVAALCLWMGLASVYLFCVGDTKHVSCLMDPQKITCPKMRVFLTKSARLYGMCVQRVTAQCLSSSQGSLPRILLTMGGTLEESPLINEYIADIQRDYPMVLALQSIRLSRGKKRTGFIIKLESRQCI